MKVYSDNKFIKNVILIGPPKSGKTTLAETMHFHGGLIKRCGSVEEKNTVSDYHDIEHERGNSVCATSLHTVWKDYKINIMDAPGIDDFVGEVISSLRVMDTCVMTVNAQHGLEVAHEVLWNKIEGLGRPLAFVMNQLDHSKSQFDHAVKTLKERFGLKATVFQFPVNEGENFNSIIDLVEMCMYVYTQGGAKPEKKEIPADLKDQAEELRNEFIEKVAESDEKLMEIYFAEGTLSPEQIINGLKAGILNNELYPIFCASAKYNMGVERIIEFIATTTPSTFELPPEKTKDGKDIVCSDSNETVLFIYKTLIDPFLGKVSYFKVLSGKLNAGSELVNIRSNDSEKLNQIFVMDGKNRQTVETLVAGDIGAAVKLKSIKTNDVLAKKGSYLEVAPINFPGPRIEMAIEAESKNDSEKMVVSLREMAEEDPTFTVEFSKELKQLIVKGQGELQLDLCRWKLDHYDKIKTSYIKPRIPYRETIQMEANSSYRHKKQSGGAGQFGEVHMRVLPYFEDMPNPAGLNVRAKDIQELPWGGKLCFFNCIVGGVIDARFIPSILKGIMEKMEEGPITGSYARDVAVAIYDGKMHPVDSNDMAFKIAGRMAFKDAFLKAKPKLLEPICSIEVLVPEDLVGDVMGDLQGRRSVIQGIDSKNNFQVVKAKAPLAELYKYSTSLKSITQGRAAFSLEFSEYATVPGELQSKLAEEYAASQEEK
ncbi:MAG: elongation factor G [Bdellovibrionales bacterium RIFOXYB1_FULL_37_110]|nr:MAG: elongation factor G [Bdellovibrionales bacterium RIFOXYA1_FULL_38_20]OFZ51053.1 MAG: elongation factor G [Bdellovibrionales bacterium RIFOXYC1_FULL_37_79]OFZ60265.1 MAG: elongation factor G [Bdellovibrionales bacterium RIFOXYB1_FULL_37_110]OFZ63260.1 MAG: elongation factor G [Bdellovibrionales bacterium RIFOXYD1_FULL_36_51]